jgi:hypothetical protein
MAVISGLSIISLEDEDDSDEDSLDEALDSPLMEDPSEVTPLDDSSEEPLLEKELALEAQEPKSSKVIFMKRNTCFFIPFPQSSK